MSTTNITNEVVRMTFEGGDFEKKISKSLSALQKLKEHLSFGKATSEAEDNLSHLVKTAERISEGMFSIWGKTIGKIKDAISDKILGTLREVKDMTVNQLSAGWDKYAKKTEAVATLVGQGYDMDTVNKQMELLNRYTDETSYAFTEMVQSIGKFTAAGQSLEDANLAMQGIANWAALSGANATKASSAMYQLSQAMGKGALKLDDYKSIQNLGMDTQEFRQHAIDAAIALGTLKRNADDTYTVINDEGKAVDKMTFSMNSFTENLTDGMWFTSDVMMKVFGEYGSAIENINKQIDSGLADIASDAIENLEKQNEEIKEVFKGLIGNLELSDDEIEASLNKWTKIQDVTEEAIDNYLQFNKKATREQAKSILHQEYLDNLKKFADEFKISTEEAANFLKKSGEWTDTFGLKAYKAGQEAKTFRDAIDSVKDAASTQWMNVWEKIFGDYATARSTWTKFANYLYDLLVDWIGGVNKALDDWVARGGRTVLLNAFANIGEALMSIKELIGEVAEILFGEFTGKSFMGLTQAFARFTARLKEFVIAIKDSQIIQNVAAALRNVADAALSIIRAFTLGFRSVFPRTAASMNPILNVVKAISEGLLNVSLFVKGVITNNIKNINKLVSGVFSVIKALGTVIKVVLKALGIDLNSGMEEVGFTLSKLAGDVFDFFGKVGDWLTEFSKKMESSEVLDKIREKVLSLKDIIVTYVWPIIKGILGILISLGKIAGSVFLWMGEKVLDAFKKIPWEKIKNLFSGLKEKLEPLGELLKSIGSGFKDGLNKISSSMKGFNEDDNRSIFQKILDALSEGFKAFRERVSDAWKSFKEVLQEITTSHAFVTVANFFKAAFAKIKEVFLTYVLPVIKYLWEAVSGPVKKILDLLRQGKIKEILDLVKSAMQINTLHKITTFFKTFTEFFKDAHLADIIRSISGTFRSISKMFDNLADTAAYAKTAVKAWKNEKNANALLKIVAVLAIIIGIVFALSFISPERAKKMGEALVIVLSIALIIVGLLLAVSKAASKGGKNLLSLSAVFVSIAAAILIIAKVIDMIGEQFKNNTAAMIVGTIAVIGLMAILIAAIISLVVLTREAGSALGNTRLLGLAAVIASFGAAIALISISLKKIGELDATDFWQAIAGVTIMILTLASATWLLNVQKSQKGTFALIALVLVIRYLLIPTLRSIAKNKFDLGQALAAIFIPLLTLTGYIFAMTKMIKTYGTSKIIESLLLLVAMLVIIDNTLIPALATVQHGESLINAGIGMAISLIAMTAVIIVMTKVFEAIRWESLIKGAVGLTAGCLAISIAMMAMGQAIGASNGNEGFVAMGLGMAIVLVAMAGAMSMIGTFAPAAITGASAILILAAAIAILTQAIIEFKKYVLGDDLDDIAEATTAVSSNGHVPTNGKINKQTTSGAIQPAGKSKKQLIKEGQTTAETVAEGVKKGTKSTKSKKLQNETATELLEGISDGNSSISSEEILKDMGIDTTDTYIEGLEDYEAAGNLKEGGEGITKTTSKGIIDNKSLKALANASDINVEEYINELLGTNNKNDLQDSGENVAGEVGTGVEGADVSSSAEELVQNIIDGTTNSTSTGIINAGVGTDGSQTNTLAGLINNAVGNANLSSSGADIVSSITGGMNNDNLVGGFISGAVGGLVDKIKAKFQEKMVNLAEQIFTPFAWIYDWIFGSDSFNTGQDEAGLTNAKIQGSKIFAENNEEIIKEIQEANRLYQEEYAQLEKIRSSIGEEQYQRNLTTMRTDYQQTISELAYNYGIAREYSQEIGLMWVNSILDDAKQASDIVEELTRLDEKLWNLGKANNEGNLTESNQRWLRTYVEYLDEYKAYIKETGDLSIKYEDFIDSIIKAEDRAKEYFGEDETKNFVGVSEKSIDQMIKEYKESGTVLYDTNKKNGEMITEGLEEGIGDKPTRIAHDLYKQFDDGTRTNFGIHSPADWAIEIMKFVMEGFAESIREYLYLLDEPLQELQNVVSNAVLTIISEVQYLLDNSDISMHITPVLDSEDFDTPPTQNSPKKSLSTPSMGVSYSVGPGMNMSMHPTEIDTSRVKKIIDKIDTSSNQSQTLDIDEESINRAISSAIKGNEDYLKQDPPVIEIHNEVGVETIVKQINKSAKMNNNTSGLKFVRLNS